jgi:hypothetical protein
VAKGPVLSRRDWALVGDEYASSAPYRFAVLDTFFRAEALEEVRQQLSGGWGTQSGALATQSVTYLPEVALAAGELKARLPTILGPYRLARGWAFLNQQNFALKVHADVGAVTLNVWLTPDEHNLDPATGGLLLLDVQHQPDSVPEDSVEWAERHLVGHPSDRILTVPYACNRAVLFDARTFHGSDRVSFSAAGPDTRRVNLSLVFA